MRKLQTATIISLCFCSLLACAELNCDWSQHNQFSWKISGVDMQFSEFDSKYCNCWKMLFEIITRFYFKSTGRLSLIVRVNAVLNRTVVVDSDWHFDNLCVSHLQSRSELYHVSWWYYFVWTAAKLSQQNRMMSCLILTLWSKLYLMVYVSEASDFECHKNSVRVWLPFLATLFSCPFLFLILWQILPTLS